MSEALFHLSNVTLPGSDVPRLNSITLMIPRGSTAVIGLSGAGKTSLLNVLSGFETDFFGGLKSNVLLDARKRLPLFWVPQTGGLWPHLSVEQHLEVVCDARRSATESGRFAKRTDEFLGLFDLNHRRKALPDELSKGERSRLALARALATQAAVLLLDEPLSHVDPIRKPRYWEFVRQIVEDEEMSMIFTSHEPETVQRQAEHVICLQNGAVVFEGAVRTLYNDPPNSDVGAFLGPLNWFTSDEAGVFLKTFAGGAIRPEHLRLCVADSSLELVSTPFTGVYCESVVRHVESGKLKSVFHQSDTLPSIGARVELRRLGAFV